MHKSERSALVLSRDSVASTSGFATGTGQHIAATPAVEHTKRTYICSIGACQPHVMSRNAYVTHLTREHLTPLAVIALLDI